MRKLFTSFICILFSIAALTAAEKTQSIPITLEFAKTGNELMWGLMQRNHLPPNHGMLFVYNQPIRASFWSFNCLIDLSIAFIDGNHVIREILDLKAYPEKMDPNRPVKNVKDIHSLYPANDPIVRFFQSKGITPSISYQYALEMNTHWFQDNGVKPGDTMIWNEETASGVIIRSK